MAGKVLSAALCAVLFLLSATFVAAQSIALSLKDGSFTVTGNLLSFDGEFYEIETAQYGNLTLAASTTQCVGDACPDPSTFVPVIRIAGSASLGELLVPSLIENFATQRGLGLQTQEVSGNEVVVELQAANQKPVARFQITLSSTAEGYAALSEGRADIVMARRGPTQPEIDVQRARYQGGSTDPFRVRVIGWENLQLYTNFSNPVSALTVSQLSDMITSSAAQWPTEGLDGPDLHLRGDIDSLIAMSQQFMHADLDFATGTGQDTDPGVLFVTPNLSLPLQRVTLASTCGSIEDGFTFSEDGHPLSAPIYLNTAALRHPPIMRQFLDFSLTVPAQRVVSRAGFRSRTPSETPLASDNGLLVNAILNATSETAISDLQRAVRRLKGYGRLSLSFRFEEGTRTLNAVSKSNLRFAAALLTQGRYQDRDILFAGFSDGIGAADGNLTLSRERAQAVRDEVRTIMGRNAPPLSLMRAHGFGEALPLACNDTDWGQNQNRRVEIWIR